MQNVRWWGEELLPRDPVQKIYWVNAKMRETKCKICGINDEKDSYWTNGISIKWVWWLNINKDNVFETNA